MNLEPKDRLILLMLCEIARKVGATDLNLDLISKAVSSGHDWAIDWEMGGVLPEKADDLQHVREVTDILDMWRFIEQDFANLDAGDKESVKKSLGMTPKFNGFDGNNEIEHMSIARMMIETMGRFDHFKGRNLNSHYPSLDAAISAVSRFEKIRPGLVPPKTLTAVQIIEILKKS